jgi:ornithine cyclodeaminase/alanine dehydrogenase-like protein (mu-crystallin family)
MSDALMQFSSGQIQQPVRGVLAISQHAGWLGLMPAVSDDLIGVKLVTVYPRNAERGLPTHLATIQLFRADTGELVATLDGRYITEARTAAVSAVATRLLAPENACVLALLGSGVQAEAHLEALRLVRHFEEVRVWSPTAAHVARFAEKHGIRAMPTAEKAVRDADVVVTVTASAEPVLAGRWLKTNAYVNAVGAVGPERRELDAEAMDAFVVVDSREAAAKEAGDLLVAGKRADAELGELLTGKTSAPTGRRIVFKSLGIAAEDLVAARAVYRAATATA